MQVFSCLHSTALETDTFPAPLTLETMHIDLRRRLGSPSRSYSSAHDIKFAALRVQNSICASRKRMWFRKKVHSGSSLSVTLSLIGYDLKGHRHHELVTHPLPLVHITLAHPNCFCTLHLPSPPPPSSSAPKELKPHHDVYHRSD